MSYTYRQLGPTDVALMRRLIAAFRLAFDEEKYESAVPNDDYLRAFLTKPHVIALAALDGPDVVGGLVAYELDKFEQDRREIYIYDLAVLEDHRRRGIARHLIHTLRGIAKARDAYVIYVQADRGDDPAIRLYESLGRREDVFHFDIPVD